MKGFLFDLIRTGKKNLFTPTPRQDRKMSELKRFLHESKRAKGGRKGNSPESGIVTEYDSDDSGDDEEEDRPKETTSPEGEDDNVKDEDGKELDQQSGRRIVAARY